ncbi:MAG: (d)CMP kinase [Gammaproteobacteria bacterium]|nr:(d)CMP kinase [Gammaproteobacteria bacterium]
MPDVNANIPVLTVDGPSGSGKGTVARLVAARLGWRFLDSGALYRLLALAAEKRGVSWHDEAALSALALALEVEFVGGNADNEPTVMLSGEDVSLAIRSESCGNNASKVAALPGVREALLARQRAFREQPGLVADGRDMGTVVFPDAGTKVFLEASPEERAARRHKQLKEKGIDASLRDLVKEIAERDTRDRVRCVSPLKPAEDARVIDTTSLSIDEVVDQVMALPRSGDT